MTATVKRFSLFSPTTSLVKLSVFKCHVVYRIHIYVENLVLFNKTDAAVLLLYSWHSYEKQRLPFNVFLRRNTILSRTLWICLSTLSGLSPPHFCPLSVQPRLLTCDFAVGQIIRTSNEISTSLSHCSGLRQPCESTVHCARTFSMRRRHQLTWLVSDTMKRKSEQLSADRDLEENTVSIRKQTINFRAEKFHSIY